MNTPDSRNYFYAVGKQRRGPVDISDLQKLAMSGDLCRTDRVWAKGMKTWVKAGSIEEIFESVPPDLSNDSHEEDLSSNPSSPVLQADQTPASIWIRALRAPVSFFIFCLVLILVAIALMPSADGQIGKMGVHEFIGTTLGGALFVAALFYLALLIIYASKERLCSVARQQRPEPQSETQDG